MSDVSEWSSVQNQQQHQRLCQKEPNHIRNGQQWLLWIIPWTGSPINQSNLIQHKICVRTGVCACWVYVLVHSQSAGGSYPSQHCWERSPGSLCASWRVPPELESGSPSSGWPPLRIELAHCSCPSRGLPSPHAGSDRNRRNMYGPVFKYANRWLLWSTHQRSGWHSHHMLYYCAILWVFTQS